MISLLIEESKVEIEILYFGNKEEYMREEENYNIIPFVHSSPRLNMYHSLSCHPQGY